ncbi:MAG: enoyl-CoA hydratase/isomerase family protein [Burkholderiales bacterium]|jgi:3-hydroxyacyl-CoA dehydrogenase|nr:enoyl-CoA hydratase/isomerase family protein [Burkholderiales bacterium]
MTTDSNYAIHGSTAVIYLDNPPVNSLGHALRVQLDAHLRAAIDDPSVDSVVITGRGKLFCGGADVKAFNTPMSRAEPSSRSIIARIEAGTMPVVAAIHGNALGLGLEFAMSCHYRVASPGARLGLPEVKLGLLPGGGGTQRLPRLVGAQAALRMITTGDAVDSREALELGLIDELIEGDLVEGAVAFARRIVSQAPHRVTSRMRAEPVDTEGSTTAFFAAQRAVLERDRRGLAAPRECLACVEAAYRLPFDEGMAFERERFDVLVNSVESKAMRHLFFAERAAARVEGVAPDTAQRPIRHVAVLGAGTMGGGIAMSFASAGFQVSLIESKPEALERGLGNIRKNYASTVSKGRLSQADVDARIARIGGTLDFQAVAQADLVIEAVFEDMAVKKEVFEKLDAACKPGAVLATNTSRLDVNTIASFTRRQQDVIGLHFFSPANVMRLVEVVRGQATSPEVIATCLSVVRKIGKLPVVVGVCDGFVGNRMVSHYAREAEFLLEEGATPQQVDRALQDFGLAMGRFAMTDLAGLDIGWASRKRLAPTRPAHLRYSKVADRICEMGRFGQKTGAGYYRYESGSRTPIPDPEIDAVIAACAAEAGIERRPISDEEIVERTMYALINEGAKILEEGVVQRASDIDLIYVNGYGFPARRGGPMFLADTIGLAKVYARICQFHATHGEWWKPSALLQRLAEGGKTFAKPE